MTVTQGTSVHLTGVINCRTGSSTARTLPPPNTALIPAVGRRHRHTDAGGGRRVQLAHQIGRSDTYVVGLGTRVIVRGRSVNDYSGYHSWGTMTATWLTVLPGSVTPTGTLHHRPHSLFSAHQHARPLKLHADPQQHRHHHPYSV